MFCIDMESMSEQNRALMIASSPRGGDEISTDGKKFMIIVSRFNYDDGSLDIISTLFRKQAFEKKNRQPVG